MDELDFEKISLSKEEMKIIEKAMKTKNYRIKTPSRRMCEVGFVAQESNSRTEQDGHVSIEKGEWYVLADAINYFNWHKRKRYSEKRKSVKEDIFRIVPIILTTGTLVMSILNYLK